MKALGSGLGDMEENQAFPVGSSPNQLQQELQEDGGGGGQLVLSWTKMLAQPWQTKANSTNTLMSFSVLKLSYSFFQI